MYGIETIRQLNELQAKKEKALAQQAQDSQIIAPTTQEEKQERNGKKAGREMPAP